ncbi:MAG: H+transporting two-sector ATPase C subunit [Anaerolineae bacterium]|nr:H+transporting two-sector ATPase C subunit [Anaerolineae bacterium]
MNGKADAQTARKLVLGLGGFNLLLALAMIIIGIVWLAAPPTAMAADEPQAEQPTSVGDPYASLAAAISVGLGSIGAAYAVGATGSAAIGVIAEKPETFGRVLIFVGLAEGIAIYGLIIAFMILGR